MLIAPNQTIIEADVLSIEPPPDGHGINLTVHVLRNLSEEKKDFIRPSVGQNLLLFSSFPLRPKIGEITRIKVILLAGPTGERAVVQEISPAK
jgi:hypothetical protein